MDEYGAKWKRVSNTEYNVYIYNEDSCVMLVCDSKSACLGVIQALAKDTENVKSVKEI